MAFQWAVLMVAIMADVTGVSMANSMACVSAVLKDDMLAFVMAKYKVVRMESVMVVSLAVS